MFLFIKSSIEDNWEYQHFYWNLILSHSKSICKHQVGISKNDGLLKEHLFCRTLYMTASVYNINCKVCTKQCGRF